MDDLFETVEDALGEIHLSVCVDRGLEEPRLLLENVLQRLHCLFPIIFELFVSHH